jgi:iron complex outermembrane receptor protein
MKVSNRSTLFTCILTFLLALGMALVGGTAMGQDSGDQEEFLLEDIVVTSEFREKSIQETPLSITAVNADMLEARNQISLDQISMSMPNVTLRPAAASTGSALIAYIRGIGQTDFNPSVEPGVAVYVDDVYYATITGNILDLVDIDRVEVLRGPQGTLAGRNAIGGAIKLFTRKADGSDDGFVSLTYGDYDRLDVKAAAGFTIVSDKLFARIAGVSRSRDGYITRLDYACANNLPSPGNPGGLPTYVSAKGGLGCELGKEGGQSMTAGRFSLRWVASDNFEVNFAANIVRDKSEAQPNVLVAAADNSGSAFPWLTPNGPASPPFASTDVNNPLFNPNSRSTVPTYFDNNGNGVYDVGIDVPYDSRFVTGGTYTNYSTYIDDGLSHPSPLFQGSPGSDLNLYVPAIIPPINHLKADDYTLSLNWQITDNTSLLSVTSYREYLNEFADDNDGSPLSVQQLLQRMDHEQWTQELRLNTTLWDGYADLTLGGFYLDKETNEDARVTIKYVSLDFLHGPDLVPSKSKAAYGQLSMHLSDRMDLTLGARYSEDEKSYTFARHNPDGSDIQAQVTPWAWEVANPTNAAVGVNGINIEYSSTNFDYRVALDYDFSDNFMGYAQIATGYKAGGNNARPFYPSQNNAFDPEELTNYEIGIKSTLAEQLRLNASVFYNDYEAIQLPLNSCYFADPGQESPCATQENVGDGEVKGFELEGVWRPTRAFSLDFSYAYLDFEYTNLDPVANVDPDSRTPFTPEQSWSLGAQYTVDLGDSGDLTIRADYAYTDEVYASFINAATSLIEDYSLVNARVTWRSEDTKWELSLEGTNLTDKYYYNGLFDLYSDAGFLSGAPGRPKEYAFTVKRYFFTD